MPGISETFGESTIEKNINFGKNVWLFSGLQFLIYRGYNLCFSFSIDPTVTQVFVRSLLVVFFL